MFGIYKASERRVLLMNFDGATVYGLCDGILTQLHQFRQEDEDFKDFRSYLSSSPRTPITIMVDSIAEDFIAESIAHVSIMDRKKMLMRKLSQHFRGVEYASAMIYGRDKKGRKDDRVLFSAITKNELLSKWVKCLVLEQVPIISVTSPAYAIPGIAREFGFFTSADVLFVNWEKSGLRQTFFKNEKALFSRLIPVSDGQEEDLVELVRASSIQSKEYLERNELLTQDDSLDVHVITPQLSDAAFDTIDLGNGFRSIQHHNPGNQIELDSEIGKKDPITAVMLCIHRSLTRGVMQNIYGPTSALHFHRLNITKRFIAICSLAVVSSGVLLSVPIMMEAFDRQAHQRQLQSNTAPMRLMYESLLGDLPETELPPQTMALAVTSYDNIRQEMQRPLDMMAAVSLVVEDSPSIDLNLFKWSQVSLDPTQSLLDSILQAQTEISIELHGSLLGSDSHQDSDDQLQSFISSLNSIPEVEVTPIRLNIEKEPESEVRTTIGDKVLEADFALNIRRRI